MYNAQLAREMLISIFTPCLAFFRKSYQTASDIMTRGLMVHCSLCCICNGSIMIFIGTQDTP
jgi:hypothetical protein